MYSGAHFAVSQLALAKEPAKGESQTARLLRLERQLNALVTGDRAFPQRKSGEKILRPTNGAEKASDHQQSWLILGT